MLVLSRKLEESVVVSVGNTELRIQVKRISGNRVQLGFDAPEEVAIQRAELVREPAGKASSLVGCIAANKAFPVMQCMTDAG